MEAKKTVHLFLALSIINAFGGSFICSTYVIFLNQRGLDVLQVNLVNFSYFATMFLFEVPTGAIADVFGRKTSFVSSCLLMSLSCLIYSQSHGLFGFILAEVIGAIASTCSTGAFEAWLVDKLKFHNSDLPLGPIIALESQLSRIALIFGAIAGAWLNQRNGSWPWLVFGILELVCGLVALKVMKEEYFKPKIFEWTDALTSIKNTISVSLSFGKENRQFRHLLILSALLTLGVQAPNMQWQPFFSKLLPSQVLLGPIYSAISVSTMIGAVLAVAVIKRWKDEMLPLMILQVLIGISLIATAYLRNLPLALLIFLLHEVLRGLYKPLKVPLLNKDIPSKERATLLSLDSMASNIGGMFGLLGSGMLAKSFSIPFAWVISGALLCVATGWLMRREA